MPEDKVSRPELSAEQTSRQEARQDRLIAFLTAKWGGKDKESPCPYCGVDDWYVDPVPVLLHRVAGPLGTGVPVFIILCQNCGQQVHVNAYYAGLGDVLPEVTIEETMARVVPDDALPGAELSAEPTDDAP